MVSGSALGIVDFARAYRGGLGPTYGLTRPGAVYLKSALSREVLYETPAA